MLISVIIPTLNEQKFIRDTILCLKNDPSYPLVKEIIVVDGCSNDKTVALAEAAGVKVLVCEKPNRAVQMNKGAASASGKILYFLHADTFPPQGYAQRIFEAVKGGTFSGSFRLRFDWDHWFLRANSWFTRINTRFLRFGDQSLFVDRSIFLRLAGFNERLKLFEDQELARRLYKYTRFKVLPGHVVSSARKYRDNGPFRLQAVYFGIYLLYILGFSQKNLIRAYRLWLPYPMV